MNKSLKEAIDDRRMHHQLYPEFLELENQFPDVSRCFGLKNLICLN